MEPLPLPWEVGQAACCPHTILLGWVRPEPALLGTTAGCWSQRERERGLFSPGATWPWDHLINDFVRTDDFGKPDQTGGRKIHRTGDDGGGDPPQRDAGHGRLPCLPPRGGPHVGDGQGTNRDVRRVRPAWPSDLPRPSSRCRDTAGQARGLQGRWPTAVGGRGLFLSAPQTCLPGSPRLDPGNPQL